MATNKILLQPERIYHIYNRGINSADLFFEKDNYEHFLRLYDKHINPVADTFAWVLMKNHFHMLVRIKEREKIVNFSNLRDLNNVEEVDVTKRIYQQFSNLFNAYTKAINKKYKRTGALFESNFRRKLIEDKTYFINLILYINNNPVHHHIVENSIEYPWSSYLSTISLKNTKLKREEVLNWFNGIEGFKTAHNEEVDFYEIEKWLNL
jgi:REP element-mobilizing transposase RayT